MSKEVIAVSVFLVLLGAASAAVGIRALTWRFRRRTTAYAGLMMCIAIYAIAYGFEIYASDFHAKLFWLRVQYLGIVFIPAFWCITAIQYVGNKRWQAKSSIAMLFVIPVITLLVILTESKHQLFHIAPRIVEYGPFAMLESGKGLWYWIFIAYLNACIAYGSYIFLSCWLRSSSIYRKQAFLMFFASLLPWMAHICFLAGWRIYGLDITPFVLLTSTLMYWYGFRGYNLFNIAPIARGMVFDVISDAILVLDRYDRIVDFNQEAERIFKCLSASVIGQPFQEIFASYPEVLMLIHRDETITNKRIAIDHENGRRYYSPRVNRMKKNAGSIIIFYDVTESLELMDTLQTLAVRDDLTGTFKRGHFLSLCYSRLAEASIKRIPVSLIIMDLDMFKNVNDMYGHQAGDDVLKAVVKPLQSALRESDILGRFGGEEFVLFLSNTRPDDAFKIAERLRKIVEKLVIETGDLDIRVTASFGVAGVDNAEFVDFDGLFADADRALYEVKKAGRNMVVLSGTEPIMSTVEDMDF